MTIVIWSQQVNHNMINQFLSIRLFIYYYLPFIRITQATIFTIIYNWPIIYENSLRIGQRRWYHAETDD